jgi:flagellar basal body-associated protein FliL
MAKKTLKATKTGKKEESKSGKGKWILLTILIVLLLLMGVAYFFDFGTTLFFDGSDGTEMSGENRELLLEDEIERAEALEQIIQLEGSAQIGEPPAPAPVKKRIKKYYVKVEDCIGSTCEKEVVRFLKQEKLPYTKRRYKRKTEYHELISSSVFSRQSAQEKIELLKESKGVIGDPHLAREGKRYRISLGYFLDKETGIRIKSGLSDLYPKIKMDFELRTSRRSYTVNSIYTGPFKKAAAKSIEKRLQQNPEYESSTLTRMF